MDMNPASDIPARTHSQQVVKQTKHAKQVPLFKEKDD